MWTGQQSVAAQYLDSSGGFTFAPPPVSTVMHVQSGLYLSATASTGCDFVSWTGAALAVAAQQSGVNATAYTFR